MFDTRADAEELNSECSFCNREKFLVVPSPNGMFKLERCDDDACVVHCKWGHKAVYTFQEPSEEQAAIIRG